MIFNKNLALQTAKHLLQINAIKLNLENPFTWASGWKSPIYCDNRISLSYPKIRDDITAQLVNKIKSTFDKIDTIAGVATAGIPQASLVAKELNLPLVYVRSTAKKHGMKNMIEGELKINSNVLVIVASEQITPLVRFETRPCFTPTD